jgi:antitoxin ParD1/3/4
MATTIEKISIALPPEMVAQVREAVDGGEYASSSEVVRDALRDWSYKRQLQQHDLSRLKAAWDEAMLDQSPGLPADEVFARLKQRIADRAELPK